MGSNTSKSSTETAAVSQNNEFDKDVSSNPDPRSPTPEITRTPLQNKNGAKHNITKNVDLRKTFESNTAEGKLIHNNPILSAVIKNHLQSYDPRSPTHDFERTPIVITNNIDEDTKKRLHKLEDNTCGSPCLNNDSIDNNTYDSSFEVEQESPDLVLPKKLYDKFIDLALNDTLKETDEPLGSSTASNEVIENELSSKPTTLLETDFEYVKTEKEKSQEYNGEIETVDECIQISENVKNIPLFKIITEDPRSPSIGIERTPIIVAKKEDTLGDGNVEEMSDNSLIKALQNTNTELRQSNVPDKYSEGILIYEDESDSLNDTPKKSKSASSSGPRTPLSCMKNKNDAAHRSKSSNTLYDTKNKDKLQKRVSHIPRLKSLINQPKYGHSGSSVSLKNATKPAISGDCENTPPHSHRDKWDKDNSIVL
ncbi:cell division cycle-associated protein 3-like [Maniola hyperantus]|uniref:cell division cycle-associated protein 3-like n=1 Tax=Aphantopus hyperantus TaxID=2795564 RepID=UPI001567CD70|nr:uncharacterized protein LOC117987882 [Maniola hyperantus]